MKKDLTFVNSGERDFAAMFCSVTGFPAESYGMIAGDISYAVFGRTECVIEQGRRCRDIFFILEGLGAGYVITEQGKKRYVYLQDESSVVASIPTMVSGEPSRVSCEILAGSVCAKIDYDALGRLARQDVGIAEWYVKLALRGIMRISDRVEQFVVSDARERLMNFLEDNPSLAAKVQKQQLAGYLGIEPESLSRILGSRLR